MIFSSYIFLLVFLPITLICYYVAGRYGTRKIQKYILLIASLIFYVAGARLFIFIFIITICLNYIVYKHLIELHSSRKKKCLLAIAVVINILSLVLFKNVGIFSEINEANNNIIIPIGISFYTLMQIGFLVNAYHDKFETISFLDFICVSTFFPYILSGPIVKYEDLVGEICDESRMKYSVSNFSEGLCIFVLGLSKKVLIGDFLSGGVGYAFSLDDLNPAVLLLGSLSYTLQIYFDFSGYSDMAVGVGKMLNIDIPRNFFSPYKSNNIRDFWKHWHISLTEWLTNYVYIPLGGSKKGNVKRYINIIIVFVVSGFWHGAEWKFVLWGLLHGIALATYRLFQSRIDKINRYLLRMLTFIYVGIAWIPFRADSISDAIKYFKNMLFINNTSEVTSGFCLQYYTLPTRIINKLTGDFLNQHTWLWVAFPLLALLVIVFFCPNAEEISSKKNKSLWRALAVGTLLGLSIISFSGVEVFIYAGF